jgi:hypothetical protein
VLRALIASRVASPADVYIITALRAIEPAEVPSTVPSRNTEPAELLSVVASILVVAAVGERLIASNLA